MFITQIKTIDANVWDEFPELSLITKFREFREKEGDEKSSNIIKAIFYIWDVKSSFRKSGMTEDEIKKEIHKNLLGNPKFSWKKLQGIKLYFLDKNQTAAQKLFAETEIQIRELNHFLREEWEWSETNAKDKAAVMKQYKDLYKDYLDYKEAIAEEEIEFESTRGGYNKSFLERQ